MLNLYTSPYNIYLKGESAIIIWNTISDKIVSVANDSPLYSFYSKHAASAKPINRRFEARLGSEEAVHMLCEFLIPEGQGVNMNKIHSKQGKKSKEDLEIVVTTTLGCNFACSYCCQGSEKDYGVFNSGLADTIMEIITNSEAARVHVTWYGGEPLLHYKRITEASRRIGDYCTEKKLSYSSDLLSNGYLLNTKIGSELCEAGISFIQLSLDGSRLTHDKSRHLKNGTPTFDMIMRNIEAIERDENLKLKLSVRINIYSAGLSATALAKDLLCYNVNEWKKVRFYLAPIEFRLGTDESSETKVLSPGLFSEFYQEFIELADKTGIPYFMPGFYNGLCTATKSYSMIIDPKGNIFKCWDEIIKEDNKVGTTENSASEIIGLISHSRWADFDASKLPLCSKCKLLPVCGGNCAIKHDKIEVYNGYHSGCPPVKLILKQYLIHRAITRGVITAAEALDFKRSAIDMESLQICGFSK